MIYLSGIVRAGVPAMLQPGMGNRPPDGQPWAADNGRFAAPKRYSDAGYLRWLELRSDAAERCLFATAPDAVGDATTTLLLSAPMYGRIRAAGYRVALVAQDGLERLREFIPWHAFDAFFIGGTTTWKLGEAAHELALDAKRRGKWLHMGRVNSLRRVQLAASMGCNSVDGTYLRFRQGGGHRDRTVEGTTEIETWISTATRQERLW